MLNTHIVTHVIQPEHNELFEFVAPKKCFLIAMDGNEVSPRPDVESFTINGTPIHAVVGNELEELDVVHVILRNVHSEAQEITMTFHWSETLINPEEVSEPLSSGEFATSAIEALKAQLSTAETVNDKLMKQVHELNGQVDALNGQVDALTKERDALSDKLKAALANTVVANQSPPPEGA